MRGLRRLSVAVAIAAGAVLAPVAHSAPTTAWAPTLPVSQQSRQVLSALPDGTGYVFDVGSDLITLWHSGNYGETWDDLTYLPAGITTFARARFATDKVGYMIDFDRLLETTDGATAPDWKQLPGPKLPKKWSATDLAIGVTGDTVAFGGDLTPPLHLGCNPPAAEDIWTSHDAGHTWIAAALPKSTMLGEVRYLNSREGVALAWEMRPDGNPCEYSGTTNSLYVTHDGGHHFRKALACGATSDELCTAAFMLDSRHILAGRNDGTMVISTDGGRTFHAGPSLPTIIGPQPTQSHNDADFWIQGFALSGQQLFATTKFAGAFLSSDDGRTWTRENTCDTAFGLGIGEIAAFDASRAIAGGPTCIATRVAAGSASMAPHTAVQPSAPGTGFDFRAAVHGMTISLSSGRVVADYRVLR